MSVIMFPGQGSQYKGMGKNLFSKYRKETDIASEVLGYDIEELCLVDSQRKLNSTEFTQPALFVVNALGYFEHKGETPSFLTGHSLGEYNALFAAGAFDFETGLQLVQKRGALMGASTGGTMAAVLGLNSSAIKQKLELGRYDDIDIANYNTHNQIVLSGPKEAMNAVIKDFDGQGIKIIPLNVSAPFHSRYMKPAAAEFASFLKEYKFSPLKIPVISNVRAIPYEDEQIAELLSLQISNSVNWTASVEYLLKKNVKGFEEIGGIILTKMVAEIKQLALTDLGEKENPAEERIEPAINHNNVFAEPKVNNRSLPLSMRLGSNAFREEYGLKYSYLTGGMYRGIASKELVVCMARAGMMGFLGTGGMSLSEIEKEIQSIQQELSKGEAYGMNLLHNMVDPLFEMNTVELYLKKGIKRIEASAYMQVTESLVYYRLKGLSELNGKVVCEHKILAKISRPEVAEEFMKPAPAKTVRKLLEQGLITEKQAELSKRVPMSFDICVEADSGGHTDAGVAMVLFPSIQQLRAAIQEEYQYDQPIRIGLAGGIGTPGAIACTFVMGADFVLTGSINQCTVEAGVSDSVKDLLQDINVQDTDYAPAGDMFEIGSRVQVLKKGVLFPARANKLYSLYSQYNSLQEIPEKTIGQLEKNYFKKSIAEIWEETKAYLIKKGLQADIAKAEENGKQKMALVFRWYFGYSSKAALEGRLEEKVNYQVHTGPALGAFNQWVKGTELESWKKRHADKIGIKMMEAAAQILEETLAKINN